MFAPLTSRRAILKPEALKSDAGRRRDLSEQKVRVAQWVGWGLAGGIQAKLSVGAVNDPLEAEADRTAEQVVHQPGSDGSGGARRRDAAGSGHEGSNGSSNELLSGAGRPLEPSQRAFFEPRFGYDFSRVRIFSDEEAAKSAQSLGARAYTTGTSIAFGGGQYRPGTGDGRRLLAHELTHVVQQNHTAEQSAPSIQRDPAPKDQQNTPPGTTDSDVHISITKRYMDLVSRAEVVQALTDYLNEELRLQGTRGLAVTDRVRGAVVKLFQSSGDGDPGDPAGSGSADAYLSHHALPGSPADFAAMVGNWLPDFIPKKRIQHLSVVPVKAATPGGLKQKAKEAVDKIGKPPEDVRKPSDSVEAPSNTPTMGGSQGQHDIKIPEQPFGDAGRKSPKPNLPEPPPASSLDAVEKIVQALPGDALVPASAKGTPQAANFGDSREVARGIANQLAAAEANKQDTVTVTLGPSYRHLKLDDLIDVFDKTANIVQEIAKALPDGVKNVKKVTITPGREKGGKIPPQRDVMLHEAD